MYLLENAEDFLCAEVIQSWYVSIDIPLHGVRLSGSGLPIGKAGDLSAHESVVNERADGLLVDLLVVCCLIEGKVEVEGGFLEVLGEVDLDSA